MPVTGPDFVSLQASDRLLGFCDAMREASLEVRGEWIIGDPVQRRVRPVETNFAAISRVSVVMHL